MSIKRSAFFFGMLGVSLAVPAVVIGLYYYSDGKQQTAREESFADVSQCLFGEIVADEEEVTPKVTAMQARGGYLPDDMRWVRDGEPWPQNCVKPVKKMMDAVRTSSLMDEQHKLDLLKDLDGLSKELDRKDAHTAYIASPILTMWKTARQGQVKPAVKSTFTGPPPLAKVGADAKAAELPFSDLKGIPGGPRWHFIANRSNSAGDTLGSCAPSPKGLSCVEFKSPGFIQHAGTWDSPDFIPIADATEVKLLHGAKVESLGEDFKGASKAHVDDRGTVFALNSLFVKPKEEEGAAKTPKKGEDPATEEPKPKKKKKPAAAEDPLAVPGDEPPPEMTEVHLHLVIQPYGKPSTRIDLVEALGKTVDDPKMLVADLMGKNLIVNKASPGAPQYVRIPFDDDGKLGAAAPLPESPLGGAPLIQRAGAEFVLAQGMNSRQPKLLWFENGAFGAPLAPPMGERTDRTIVDSSSGAFSIGKRVVCRKGQCVEVFKEPAEKAAGRARFTSPQISDLDLAGDRVVYSWAGRDGEGLFLRVGGPEMSTLEGTDYLVRERLGNHAPSEINIFGGSTLIVVARSEGKLLGARVTKDGEVGAVEVAWQ